jgi:hypothetical protein
MLYILCDRSSSTRMRSLLLDSTEWLRSRPDEGMCGFADTAGDALEVPGEVSCVLCVAKVRYRRVALLCRYRKGRAIQR